MRRAGVASGRQSRHHHRRVIARSDPPLATRVAGRGRAPVWVLPVRTADERSGAAARETAAYRPGHRSGHDRQHLPMWNVSAYPAGHPPGGRHGRQGRCPMSSRSVSIERVRNGIARREFLKFSVAASGGLLVGFYFPGTGSQASAQESAGSFMANAFVRIGTDERVTVIVNHSEMGQGVYTSLPMLLAEELDADWSKVGFESAPVDPKYNHPAFGMQVTGGSSSVWSGLEQFRQAGAAARAMLVAAAAQRWGTDIASCRTESGAVFDTSNRKLTHGQLVADPAKLPPPEHVQLKDPKNFKLIRKPIKRLDTSIKLNGKAVFGLDVNLPGMLI